MRNKKIAYSAVHVWVKCMVEYAVFCITDYSYLKIKQTININEQSDVKSPVGGTGAGAFSFLFPFSFVRTKEKRKITSQQDYAIPYPHAG